MNQFLYIIGGVLLWTLVVQLLKLSKSKYFKKETQRNNFISVLHGYTIPIITLFYLLSFPSPFGYHHLIDDNLSILVTLSISYYIFSFFNMIIVKRKSETMDYFHHFVVAAFLWYFISNPEFPIIYGYILVPQCTTIFYHTYLIIKESSNDDSTKNRAELWYNMNFYGWIFFRFIIEGLLLALVFYYEFTLYALDTNSRIIMVIGFGFSYFFNFYWMMILMKNRKKRKTFLLNPSTAKQPIGATS